VREWVAFRLAAMPAVAVESKALPSFYPHLQRVIGSIKPIVFEIEHHAGMAELADAADSKAIPARPQAAENAATY